MNPQLSVAYHDPALLIALIGWTNVLHHVAMLLEHVGYKITMAGVRGMEEGCHRLTDWAQK